MATRGTPPAAARRGSRTDQSIRAVLSKPTTDVLQSLELLVGCYPPYTGWTLVNTDRSVHYRLRVPKTGVPQTQL